MIRPAIVAIFLLLAACTTSSSPATSDAGADTSSPGVCPPPPGASGNSKNVGAYCTPNGGECTKYSASLRCSIDLDPRGDKFCILLGCQSHGECGELACCTGDPGNPVHACVPLECVVDDSGGCPPIP